MPPNEKSRRQDTRSEGMRLLKGIEWREVLQRALRLELRIEDKDVGLWEG